VQFHAEVTHHMMCRWTTRGHERLTLPGARPRHEHFEGRVLHDGKVRAWLEAFLDHWTGLMEQPGRISPAVSQIAKAVAE
jgi:GMP synthase (glutamine-hydrolysing)